MTFFTSDLHLGHSNILQLCHRPFETIQEMDEALICNWNKKVHKCDTVYIVGDIVWDKKRAKEYLSQLNGKKILIYGNHDEHMIKDSEYQAFFEEICPMKFAHLNGHPITFCHYPMLEWKSSRKEGSKKLGVLIYGHIHNRIDPMYRFLYESENALNAGVDVNGYSPVSFDELVDNNVAFKKSALDNL